MSYQATVYNLMIASPGDVTKERDIVREVVHEWNGVHSKSVKMVLMPLGWETHSAPMTGGRAQDVINSQILDHSDLLVAIFWTRIGTRTGDSVSGTAEEIQKHVAAGRPAMIYFSGTPAHPDTIDPVQYAALKEFKDWCFKQGLVQSFDSSDDFREKFRRQLATVIHHHEMFSAQRDADAIIDQADFSAHPPELSEEAKTLLIEAAESVDGFVGKIAYLGGAVVQANGKNFVEPNNPRSRAEWEGAIEELVVLGYLNPQGYKGEMFRITREGYNAADELKKVAS